MGRVNYYNVYEGERLVLECVTAKEIAAKLNYTVQYVQRNIVSGKLLGGIYSITFIADNSGQVHEDNFTKEWNEVIKPFKNVKWSKKKGKKLIVTK